MGNAATTKKGDSTESGEWLQIGYKELQKFRQNIGNDAVPLLMMGINKLIFSSVFVPLPLSLGQGWKCEVIWRKWTKEQLDCKQVPVS